MTTSKRMAIAAAIALLSSAGLSGVALAAPLTYTLPDETATLHAGKGAGFEATQNNCTACHSLDYINMQPPKMGAGFWTAEVTKMIKTYHASIDEADAKAIAEFLSQAY